MSSVRALAGEFRGRHRRLDLLVNNAGSVSPARRESADGVELTFAANYLGHFLLTHLLLDLLVHLPNSCQAALEAASREGSRHDRLLDRQAS